MSDPHEPVTVTDKRRIDPETGEVRASAAGAASNGPTPAAAPPAEASSVEEDKAAELIADLQRVQADFANYRKRSLRDQQVAGERAKATVVIQLLPVLDDLDRARSHGDLDSGPLRAVADKLVSVLEGLGLSGFGAEGDDFDPALHEAVQHEGDGTVPIVGMVLRRGYRIGDQVVRHALVGVVDTVPEADTSAAAPADTPDNSDGAAAQTAESEG